MDAVTKEINQALVKRISKEIDFDVMAKKLKPQLEKAIFDGLLQAIKDVYWDELIHDIIYSKKYGDSFDNKIAKMFGLKAKPVVKKGKK